MVENKIVEEVINRRFFFLLENYGEVAGIGGVRLHRGEIEYWDSTISEYVVRDLAYLALKNEKDRQEEERMILEGEI